MPPTESPSQIISPLLGRDERLLWSAQPRQGIFLRAADAYLIRSQTYQLQRAKAASAQSPLAQQRPGGQARAGGRRQLSPTFESISDARAVYDKICTAQKQA